MARGPQFGVLSELTEGLDVRNLRPFAKAAAVQMEVENSIASEIAILGLDLPVAQCISRPGHAAEDRSFGSEVVQSEVKVLVAQSCPTLCNPIDYSPPGFSVHGILQARKLEWVAFPFSRGSSQPRDRTQVSCITGGF